MLRVCLAVLLSNLLILSRPVFPLSNPETLIIVTHDSFAVSEEVLQRFQDETGIAVQILRTGDAGAMLNQSILSKSNPLGDVLFGVDNAFLGRALDHDLFIPYESPHLVDVPDEFQLDSEFRVTPIDYGDVCLNYDVAYFKHHEIPLPESLADLTRPEYRSLLTVQNPATSSPGLAFLLATVSVFGDHGAEDFRQYWADLVSNDVYVSESWTDAYYNQFSGSSGSQGNRPLVVSYASSPIAEVFFMETPPDEAPTSSIVADSTCFRQIEFAGVLAGSMHQEAARRWIDFMLSTEFQEDMPLQMFVFPVNKKANLPEVFKRVAVVPEHPIVLSLQEIDAHREQWIQAWTEIVLR